MARSVSCQASPGYQSDWEGPGKVGNRACSNRFPATRSAKRASAEAENEAVRQAAYAGRITLEGCCTLLGMLHNHPARSAPAAQADLEAISAGAFDDDGLVGRGKEIDIQAVL